MTIVKGKLSAAFYIRVSTDEKSSEGVSTKAQEAALYKYIQSYSELYTHNKKHIYIDNGVSGASDSRPALNKMRLAAENKEFDIIMVWKIDRYFRKLIFLLQEIEYLKDLGIFFKSITQDIDTSKASGMMMLQMLGVAAELERANIQERTTEGKISKARDGFYVGGYTPKFGYDSVKVTGGKKLFINEDEKQVVIRIFDMFVKEKLSANKIADILTNERVPTKYDTFVEGKKKNRKAIRGVWYGKTVSRLLSNNMFIGEYYYGRLGKKKDKETNKMITYEKPKSEWTILTCPILLEDKNLFYRAQELLKINRITKNNHKNVRYAFTSILECKECGKNYVGYKTSKKTLSYRCGGGIKGKSKNLILCKNNEVSEKYLRDNIWKKISEMFSNPKYILESYYNDKNQNNRLSKLNKELHEVDLYIDKFSKGLNNIYDDYYMLDNNAPEKEILHKKINDFKGKISLYNDRKTGLLSRIKGASDIELNKKSFGILVKSYKLIFSKLDEEQKDELINEFVNKIYMYKGGKIDVEFRFGIDRKLKSKQKPLACTSSNKLGVQAFLKPKNSTKSILTNKLYIKSIYSL